VIDLIDNLVSIITPAYNAEKFLVDMIRSVQKQTYSCWELIIVNDCSTDDTLAIAQKESQKDNRIKVINLSKNSGAAEARNEGIKQATGRFIAFLDSDDLWASDKLEKQLHFMKTKQIGFSFTNYSMINEKGDRIIKLIECPLTVNYKQLLKNTTIGCLTVMIDRKKLGDFRMPNIQPEDTALWLKILKEGHIAYCLQENLAYYRIVEGSASSNKIKAAKKLWNVYRKQEKLSFISTIFCFFSYSLNAIKKHYL
jgi:teichuronic acid biosynthesis glycosyltransferase TuaG